MENKKMQDLFPEEPPVEELAEKNTETLASEEIPAEEVSVAKEQDNLDLLEESEGSTEFQQALEALQAFSGRYKAEDEEKETEAPQAPVTEATISFVAPVTPPADTMGETQKFTLITDPSADPPQQESAPEEKPAKEKKIPAYKRGSGLFGIPHLISTVIWLALIVAIGVSFGRMLWVCAADLLAFGKPDRAITITVEENDSIKTIATKLKDAGIIKYPNLFVLFADITGKGDRIVPDTYNLNSMYDYNALLKMMSYKASNTEVVQVLIPEGYNCAQIFKLLDESGVCSQKELEDWAANGELKNYWFLEGLPRGTKYCLEGYLYPDTYKFYKDADPQYVLQKFLNNFETRFTDKMYNDFIAMQTRFGNMMKSNGYSPSYINSHKLTFHQFITLASIVEEEKANAAEGYDIAAVFYNRLAKPGSYPRLDSDATVYYAIGAYFERKPLTKDDLNSTSPYNTRKANGLPPGPISSPGSYSLYAALYPSETKYYYFIFDKTAGVHRFSKTLAEHNKWANKLG